jgi:hypothetical protein
MQWKNQVVLGRPMRAVVLLAGLAAPIGAMAAPFCLRNQMLAPQCIYYDAAECQRDAQRQGAVCSVNPSEFTLLAGSGQYCVVTSTRASLCVYADRNTCAAEAARQHGACMDAIPAGRPAAPDPYSAVNGR